MLCDIALSVKSVIIINPDSNSQYIQVYQQRMRFKAFRVRPKLRLFCIPLNIPYRKLWLKAALSTHSFSAVKKITNNSAQPSHSSGNV